MKKLLLFPLLLLLIYTAVAQAPKIIYVNASATGAGNGTSWADAYLDFQAGVNGAAAGDSVFVAKGNYSPAAGSAYNMENGVKIYGSFKGTEASLSERTMAAGDTSILQGNGNSVIRNDDNGLDASAVLDGFKITGGSGNSLGGGIYNDNASPILSHLTINGNIANNNGGGMCNSYSSPELNNVIISGNSAALGAGIYNFNSSSILKNVLICGNTATQDGGGMYLYQSPLTLRNVTISGNSARSGGGIYYIGTPMILNNSIVWGNNGNNDGNEIYIVFSLPPSNTTLNYSLCRNREGKHDIVNNAGSTISDFSLSVSPQFVDSAGSDYRLSAGSPAINAGTPDITGLNLPATDLSGLPRIARSRIDMGAYEFSIPVKWYVKEGAIGNGSSWSNASGDFQGIINGAYSGDSVFVAGGNYPLASGYSYTMKEGVKIYGSFAGTEASLNERSLAAGNSSVLKGSDKSVIYNTSNNLTAAAVLDGFSITGGHADYGAGMYNYESSPTISNCSFWGNTAIGYGGGMENSSASPVLINCTFSGNSVTGGAGGGIYNYASTATMTNCTFFRNTASGGGGGIYNSSSSPTATNSIFWGNTAPSGADILQSGGSISITHSYTQTDFLASSATNITGSIDPFVNSSNPGGADGIYGTPDDGLHLNFAAGYFATGASPIDAGSNEAITASILTDIAGADRNQNSTVDMGAYEGISSTQALPVTIMNFRGSLQKGKVTLQWESGVEAGFNHFEVLKTTILSSEPWQAQLQGAITAKGSNSSYTYSTTQMEPTAYYSLKVINNDGSSKLSAVVELSQKGSSQVLLYPNPAHNYINVKVATAGSIHIFDALGRLVKSQALHAGVNSIDVHALSSGAYYGVVNGTKLNFVKQ